MIHAGSEARLRGIRRGPSAWLERFHGCCSGTGSARLKSFVLLVAVLLRGLIMVRLALLGAWSSSRSLLGSRFGATSWPHLGPWFFGEATHQVGKDRCLVSPIGSSSPTLVPGPNSLKTTRGGKVRGRPWASAHLPFRAEVRIKGISHHLLGVCVCVCVSVGPSNK